MAEVIVNKKRKATISVTTSPQDRSFETPDVKSNGRVRSSVSQAKFSPIRAGRLEEKHELQELNKRLEHYILWQRERDAAQNALQQELNVLRESFETEKRHLEMQLQLERDQYKEKKDESVAQLVRLNEDVERQAAMIEQQKRQLEKDQKTIGQLRALNASMSKDNQALKTKLAAVEARLATAEEDRKSAVEELDAEREEHERLKGDLAREQKRADELNDQVARERSRGDKNQEMLESESAKSREWLTKYRELMAETSKSRQALEEELRKDFTNQLTDLIAHHDEISQKEKNEAIANLQAFHEQKAKEKTEALEQALKKADQLQAQIRDLIFREAVANREATSAKGIRDTLERTISDLNLKYSELDRKHKEEIEEKERILAEFRTRLNQQDDEFNTLMDVKIALAMEIKAYRLLLDSEEDRLELRTAKGQEKKDATASVIISRMNPEATRITIRNGTTESADLKGWRLISQKTTKEFIFPQFILIPGKTVIVHVGADSDSRLESENELAWVADGVWNDEGDTALLFDPRGRQASRVNVIPSA